MVKDIYKHLPPTPPQVLLSIEPLFGFLRDEERQDEEHVIAHLARMLSVERKSIYRWLEDGITMAHAEHLSEKLGLHPAYVWGPEYHIAVYMNEIRQKIIDTNRGRKMAIRRSIQRKEKREANAKQ